MPHELTAERIAKNDAIFRDANEQIRESAAVLDFSAPIPFICECADETCTEIVQLTTEEYETVRARPDTFFNVAGHEVVGGPHVRVIMDHGSYVVLEKVGRAGEVAAELDPRK